MNDSINLIFDEDGVAREYDDTYDITIHCESQEEQDAVLAKLNRRWIPCSERPPEEREERYWCCSEGGYQFQCRWTNDMYGLGANEYSKWGWHVMDKPQYSRVIAWMPLPKSYKEAEDE